MGNKLLHEAFSSKTPKSIGNLIFNSANINQMHTPSYLRLNTLVLFAILGIIGLRCKSSTKEQHERPLNVLFISIDDLKPELGCYGSEHIKSPNIDQLAQQGLTFNRAYCNVPVCGASRASIFSGLFPDTNRFVNYNARIDTDAPSVTILPEHLKNNGYHTISLGKTLHFPGDMADAWSERPWRPDYPFEKDIETQLYWRDYQCTENLWTREVYPTGSSGPAWEKCVVSDTAYQDGIVAFKAIEVLEQLSNRKEPFFLGLGFVKPHLPFTAPQKYWDLYSKEEIFLAPNPFMSAGAPALAHTQSYELRQYANIPKYPESITTEQAFELKHGYYACISYVDNLIGMVLTKLKELHLDQNTIIVLWSDHGYLLGEHSIWGKISNYDPAMRSTLIIKAPGQKEGQKTNSLVSFVDLYPTLCDLLSIEPPEHLDGKSLKPIFESPKNRVNDYVFCRWIEGESIINDTLNYTRFYNRNNYCQFIDHMLYDHRIDSSENINVVNDAAYQLAVENLKKELENHIRSR